MSRTVVDHYRRATRLDIIMSVLTVQSTDLFSLSLQPRHNEMSLQSALEPLKRSMTEAEQFLDLYQAKLNYPYRDLSKLTIDPTCYKLERQDKIILDHISWQLNNAPEDAIVTARRSRSNKVKERKLRMSKTVVDGPILLRLCLDKDETGERQMYLFPVVGGTIGDLLAAIHNIFVNHQERHGSSRDLFFEGLTYLSPGVWDVDYGT